MKQSPFNQLKIKQSLKIITFGLKKYPRKIAIAWSGGLDSMVLLHLTRSVIGDKGYLPVLFIDSGYEPKETYELLQKLIKYWQLSVIRITDKFTLRQIRKMKSKTKRKGLMMKMKIRALKKAIKEYRLKAIFAGIRWEEQEAYQSEVYVSPRKNHIRFYPLLHFTRKDILSYIKQFDIPHRPQDGWEIQSPRQPSLMQRILRRETLIQPKQKAREKVSQRLRIKGYF